MGVVFLAVFEAMFVLFGMKFSIKVNGVLQSSYLVYIDLGVLFALEIQLVKKIRRVQALSVQAFYRTSEKANGNRLN